MLKSLITLVLTSFLMMGHAALAEDALFSKAIEDLPLMEGMVEHDTGVQFSTSAGRIAEVIVDAPYSKAAVLAFYQETLPQLGWAVLDDGAFVREGEMLKLTIEGDSADVAVRFELTPQ